MARPRKNSAALQGAYTKEVMEERLESEKRLKGDNDKLYPPDFIKQDEIALKKFDEIVYELNKAEILSNVDVDLLAIYCDSWSNYVRATKMLSMQSLIEEQEGKTGVVKTANPYIKVQQSYAQQMTKLASLFGLSPADRSKIAHLNPSDKEQKADPLLELLSELKS